MSSGAFVAFPLQREPILPLVAVRPGVRHSSPECLRLAQRLGGGAGGVSERGQRLMRAAAKKPPLGGSIAVRCDGLQRVLDLLAGLLQISGRLVTLALGLE